MNFLSELMESVSELESPSSFYWWAGIAAISAVVKDNIWIDRGEVYNCYPNIYIMFHAESGLKKGPPVNLAKDLVRRVNNTHIISGRSSIQGILKKMGTAYTAPGGKIVQQSKVFICSSELTSSIVEDKAAAGILTDLYDRNYNEGDWESLLKMENFKLRDATVTMLGATNEAMSKEFFHKQAIQGGYFARTFIIYESEENTVNSLILPPQKTINKDTLVNYLKVLSQLRGPFVPLANREMTGPFQIEMIRRNEKIYCSAAGKIYEDWYAQFKREIKDQKIIDKTGTLNRFGDSVLKVAMLISLSKHPVLEIDEESMLEAITKCERLIGNVRRTTMGKEGVAVNLEFKNIILEELFNREPHMITQAQLAKKYWMHYSKIDELVEIMQSFDLNGVIKMEQRGSQIVYIMPDAEVEALRNYFSGRNK